MARHQLRLLLLSVAAVVLIVAGTFFAEWFVIHIAGNNAYVDLRRIRVCAPQCVSGELGTNGMYSSLARVAFWGALPLFVVVATQAGAKLLSGFAYRGLARLGTALGLIVFFAACGAGFLAIPDVATVAGFELFTAERQWGPVMLIAGSLAAVLAVRYAMTDSHNDDVGEYRPVVIPKRGDSRERSRIPVTPLSVKQLPRAVSDAARARTPTQPPVVARTTSPSDVRLKSPTHPPAVARTTSPTQPLDARTKAPSQAPDGRTKPPSQPPATSPTGGLDFPSRARTSTSGPVDVAARLGGAQLEVSIRPPLPEAAHVPDDQIPVAPESGLVIRKRTPTAGPIDAALPPEIGVTIRTKGPSTAPPMMASVASALGLPPPSALTGRVNYAVTTAAFSGAGITATREDGLSKLIKWGDIVGIVARRLPPSAPYDGLPFVDIVSSAGATMRILPATAIIGHTFEGNVTERARTLVNLLASQALEAKLDSATKAFATGTSDPAQLRDDKTLDTHDARLA